MPTFNTFSVVVDLFFLVFYKRGDIEQKTQFCEARKTKDVLPRSSPRTNDEEDETDDYQRRSATATGDSDRRRTKAS